MYRLCFTDAYESDVYDIMEYLSQFYPSTPKKFKSALKKTFAVLKETPHSYRICQYNSKFRQATVGDYVIFYKITETSS
jgi:plasmid stabilization system protein ParE